MAAHRVYLSPGMFGFGKLATYDYFAHVKRALEARFADAGQELHAHVVDVSPTASIRRRAVRLAELVHATTQDDQEKGPIHLLGHSTGGLDARLVASPSAHLSAKLTSADLAWRDRLASITTMSTPHYGTPLASFFATVSGQRMLYAVSALTFIGLSLGAPPLAAASLLVGGLGRIDRMVGIELGILDRTTSMLLGALEPATSHEVRAYLDQIQKDQGAVVQLTPEAMDLYVAGIEDRPGVTYQCTLAAAPAPTARKLARSLASLSPWAMLSSTLFTTMYGITSRSDERYPCSSPRAEEDVEAIFLKTFGAPPSLQANDGVVPIRSQLWGRVAWCGFADHLDVLGHFPEAGANTGFLGGLLRGGRRSVEEKVQRAAEEGGIAPDPGADARHVDWLRSGANFDRAAFGAMMDAVARGMLGATS